MAGPAGTNAGQLACRVDTLATEQSKGSHIPAGGSRNAAAVGCAAKLQGRPPKRLMIKGSFQEWGL